MAGSLQNNAQLGMPTDLRFTVSYGGDFVKVDDEWKWEGNETTSLLVPSNITVEGLVVRLMEKLRIHPSTQIKLKFKVPNMNVPPAEIQDNDELNWYITFHKENALYVSLCETEVPNGLHTVRETEMEDPTFVTKEDIGQIHLKAQHQWLCPAEICEILRNYKKTILSPEPSNRPPSGSLFLFDRNVQRHFRKDGHNWRKKNGKTVKEGNEKLKVGGIDALHCYYAHGEEDQNFKRRIYWMLEKGLSHIVLVHYLEAKENRTNFNRVRESEVIPDSQKPRENIRNSEVDSSVFSESRTYNYEGTLQVTDSSNHNIAHASEFKNAESVHCQQQSPGFQPCDNVSQPMVKKMRGGSIPYYDVPISDDCQGQCLDITVQNVESNTRRGKNKNVMVQSWENVVYSNTDGFQTTNFQPLFSSAQSSTGMMLGHENELLEHVVSGAIGTRQEFGSHSNFWKLHGNSRHDPYSKIHDVNNEELYDTMGPCNTYPSNQNKHTMRSDHRKQDGLDGLPREGLKMLGNFDRWESEFGDVTGSRRCSETIDIEGGSDSFISAQVPLDNNILDRSPYRDPHYSHFMPRNFLSSQYDLSGYSFENEDVDVEPQIVQIRGPGRANPVSGLPLPPAPCPPPPPPPPPPARCCAPRPRAPCCPRRPRAPCCPPRAPCCPPPPRAPCCPPRAPCPDAYPCSGFQRSNFPAEMMSDSPLFHCEFPQKTGSEPMRTLAILFIFLVGLKICFGFLFM